MARKHSIQDCHRCFGFPQHAPGLSPVGKLLTCTYLPNPQDVVMDPPSARAYNKLVKGKFFFYHGYSLYLSKYPALSSLQFLHPSHIPLGLCVDPPPKIPGWLLCKLKFWCGHTAHAIWLGIGRRPLGSVDSKVVMPFWGHPAHPQACSHLTPPSILPSSLLRSSCSLIKSLPL